VGLLKFSLQYHFDAAVVRFPMFSAHQIREVYALTKSERQRLLAERTTEQERPRDHRTAAQKEKLRDIATDPSNR
jgi:hypothetical protein